MDELHGQSSDPVTPYGFPMAGRYPVPTDKVAKIVWRMTGNGPVSFKAVGPNGQVVEPTWGPESHGADSSWHRPGHEWGTGFRFPAAGCWTVTVTRGQDRATVGVLVAD